MVEMGELYRRLKETYGDQVKLEVIDPRNVVSFVIILWQQARRHRIGWRAFFHSFTKGLNIRAVLVNGEIVSYGKMPDMETVEQKVSRIIHQQRGEIS